MNRLSQKVAARVEELLREQLREMGVEPAELEPHAIAQNMQCDVYPDESMVYKWKDTPILRIVPEKDDEGTVTEWRMFTKGDDNITPIQ